MNSNGILISRFSFWCEGRKGGNNVALLSEFFASMMMFVAIVIALLKIAYTTIFVTGNDASVIIDYIFESESQTVFKIKTDTYPVFYAFFYHSYIMSIAVLFLVGKLVRIKTVATRLFVGLAFFPAIVFISVLALGIDAPNKIIHIEKISNSVFILLFWYFIRNGFFWSFYNRFLLKRVETDSVFYVDSFADNLLFNMICLFLFVVTVFALVVHSLVPFLDFINSI